MSLTSVELTTAARGRFDHAEAKFRKAALIGALMAGDAITITASFVIAYAVRFFTDLPIFAEGAMQPEFYTLLIALLVPGWIGIFALHGLYQPTSLFNGTHEYNQIFNAASKGMIFVIFLTFLIPEIVIARGWLVISWVLSFTLPILWRFGFRRVVYRLRKQGHLRERILVIGATDEGRAIVEQLLAEHRSGAQIIGFLDDRLPVGSEVIAGKARVLGTTRDFAKLVEQYQIETIVIADTNLIRERLINIDGAMDLLNRLEVRLAPGLFDLLTIGVQVREQGAVPLLRLNKTRITGLHAIGKTIIDRVGALIGLIVFSPLFLLIAIAIKLDSPGPIVYRRRVIGVGYREFDAFKFRTMYVDGDQRLTPEQRAELEEHGKLRDDPRITRVGKLLRRASIDELPQLFNVLCGQMSLVGPRMITAGEMRHFGRWQHNLLTVRPGLTGLWQISGRSNLGYADRVRLDMYYIRNYSIWLDLLIIVRTIPALLNGEGAY
ncbi:sugar transferase [Chloroflexus sp.]|uniref:sugar transferase n=1 Tax=Chloroflexus sp. TaxID=1904827 RepID=UPI00260586D7|nr:sugar transferase [uncultured Chloroflexus sp.]